MKKICVQDPSGLKCGANMHSLAHSTTKLVNSQRVEQICMSHLFFYLLTKLYSSLFVGDAYDDVQG